MARHRRELGAGYPVAPAAATRCTAAVLGAHWLASPRGRRLWALQAAWFTACEGWFDRLREFESTPRLIQIYRAPLRSARQVRPACHEIATAARLADMAAALHLDAVLPNGRRADLAIRFHSTWFHVEVKTHENRAAPGRLGGLRSARALAAAAAAQAAPNTPNLLVLGHLRPDAVARLAAEQTAASPWGAIASLGLRRRPQGVVEAARLHPVAAAKGAFPAALLEVVTAHWERR